ACSRPLLAAFRFGRKLAGPDFAAFRPAGARLACVCRPPRSWRHAGRRQSAIWRGNTRLAPADTTGKDARRGKMNEPVPMTPAGAQKLRDELVRLKEERPKAAAAIGVGRAPGALQGAAESHAAKEPQGLNEARIM